MEKSGGSVTLNHGYVKRITDRMIAKCEADNEESAKEKLADEIVSEAEKRHKFSNISVNKNRLNNYFNHRNARGNYVDEATIKNQTLELILDGLVEINRKGKLLPGCDKYTSRQTIANYIVKGSTAYIPTQILNTDDTADKGISAECAEKRNKDRAAKLSEERAKYLFGEDSLNGCDDKLLFHLSREWNGLPSEKIKADPYNTFTKLADRITDSSLLHPLYRYLYSNMNKNGSEAHALLQHSVTFTNTADGIDVTVLPPVSATINRINKALDDIVCPARSYTKYDFLRVAGYLARKASENPDYSIDGDVIDGLETKFNGISEIAQIKEDLLNVGTADQAGNIQWTIVDENNARKFKIRLYRLLLSAFDTAEEYNSYLDSPREITDKIGSSKKCTAEELCRNTTDALYEIILNNVSTIVGDRVHIDDEFDDIVMFATALIHSLNTNLADRLIRKICDSAYNYSVGARDTQIAMIYILSYLLCENVSMKSERREQVFKAAYSRTIYRLEQIEINRIFSTSLFYKNKIEKSLTDACEFAETENGIKTVGQPEYIFLYHEVMTGEKSTGGKAFLKKACELRSASWYGEPIVPQESITLSDITNALNELQKPDCTEKMYYAYGMQMLGYVYANEKSDKNIPNVLSQVVFTDKPRKTFLHALIISDFYCRLYNPYYTKDRTDDPDMFLLCGAHRAIATGFFSNIMINLDDDIERLNQNIPEEYMTFFKNEHGRYKFLLGRLLLHSETSTESGENYRKVIYSELCAELKSPPEFMPYDNVNIDNLISRSSDIDKFLSELK